MSQVVDDQQIDLDRTAPALRTIGKMAAILQVPPPKPMDIKGDVASNWRYFRSSFEDFSIATKLNQESDEIQVAALRSCLGQDAKTTLLHLVLTDDERKKVKPCLDALEAFYLPQVNVIFERYQFRCAVQQADEKFDDYLAKLRKLASTCAYGGLTDEMIRDNIVYGIRDNPIRSRLLRDRELKLQSAIDICKASERAEVHAKAIKSPIQDEFVNFTKRTGKSRFKNKKPPKETIDNCKYCGGSHAWKREACPAFGKKCSKCHKENHLPSCCRNVSNSTRSRKFKKASKPSKSVHAVATDTSDEDSDELVYAMSSKPAKRYLTTVKFTHEGSVTPVQCQLDTGASRNTMPCRVYKRITGSMENLKPSRTRLRTYDGSIIKPLGCDQIKVETENGTCKLHVEIVKDAPITLLSGNTSERLDLLQVNEQVVMLCDVENSSNSSS